MKVISGGKRVISPEVEGAPEQAEPEISLGQSVLGQIARPVSRAIETVFGAPGNIVSLAHAGVKKILPSYAEVAEKENLPNILPTSQDVRKKTEKFSQEQLGLNKEQLKPQNFAEELVDWTVQDLPFIFATGGQSLLSSLGRSAASGAGALGAKKAGFDQIGQFIGSLVGGNYFDAAKKAGSSFSPIRKIATNTKNKLYKEAESLAPKLNENATQFRTNIDNLINEASGPASKLTGSTQKEVVHQLENVYERIKGNSINVKDAWDQKRHLNKVIPKVDDVAATYLRRANGFLENDVLKKAAEVSPEFGKAYTTANQLHVALEVPNKIRSILEKNGSLSQLINNPVAKGLIGLGGFHYGLKKAATAATLGYGARGALRAVDFYKTPIGRQLWADIARDSIENNIPALANNLVKLNVAADEWEKENPETTSTLKVISGGKKKRS